MLGQAVGAPAALAQKDKTAVQHVNTAELQGRLRDAEVVLGLPAPANQGVEMEW